MKYQLLLISVSILLAQQSVFSYAGQHLCVPSDAFHLLQFKQNLTIDRNVYDSYVDYPCHNEARAKTLSWNVTGDCCEWDGVTCDEFTGHVIGLDLSCSFLSGTIDANNSLTKLGHLRRLNLAHNYLDGFPLGNGISELTSLTHLNLSSLIGNYSEGKTMIPPGLSQLSKFISLDLSQSNLQVGRTTFRSLLHNLEVLLFDYVEMDAPFELPKNISTSLRKLSLHGTGLFGDITDSQLFHLPNLQVLNLARNPNLTGTLPNFNWSSSGSLLELDFSGTGIFGKVPDSIGNLHSLRYLNLESCYLSGSIPESIGNLTEIRELRLSGNNFTGNVPSTLAKLNKLLQLDLSYNHFRGSIPESIGNFTRITSLGLSNNRFTGNVPSTIQKLNKLSYLSLSSNNFEGSIPDIFANFSELYYLLFDTNNFTGSFPYSIANLTRLEILELQNNSLTGPLPSNISGLQNLQSLDLSSNYFTGTTPPWLFHLSSLYYLSVEDNQLTGKLPNNLKSNYTRYPLIDFSNNKLHGEIPDWMLSMTLRQLDLSHNLLTGFEKQVWHSMNLEYLNLENNLLQGSLHLSICNITVLQALILANNSFSGSIPGCLVNSNSPMSILDLRVNNFHGEIPRSLPTGLRYLGLYGNQLSGQVPQSLVNCTSLEALDLGNNKINDTFPIWLEKLPYLQVMILKSNLFHGPIGDLESEFPFPELRIFDLSFNGFTGTLPSNLFRSFRGMIDVEDGKTGITLDTNRSRLVYLYDVNLAIKGNVFDMKITSIMTSIDLSRNRFEGDIPPSIGSLNSLVLLNLSHNNFRGHIPAEFAKLHELEELDISWNRLIGNIPAQLSSLTFLAVLNVSYNHLSGRIPLGKQFNTFPNDSYTGNSDLCGFPLSKECGNKKPPFEQDDGDDDDDDDDSIFASGFSWQAVVIGLGCGIIFGLFMSVLTILLGKPKWFVNFTEDIALKIAEEIVIRKRRRQRKRHQRHGLRMN